MQNQSRTGIPFEEAVKKAFSKSKDDISSIKSEIEELKRIIVTLNSEISHLKENNSIIKDLAQSNANSISILAESQKNQQSRHPLSSDGTSSKGNERVPNTAEQELVKIFKRNKPQIIKQKILELSQDGEYALYDIFNVIVQQQGLCGKTTFYRYIKELENEGIVEISLIEGKRTIRTSSV